MATIEQISSTGDNVQIQIQTSQIHQGVKLGDSVALNGCCLTVVQVKNNVLAFDAVPETMQRTNLGELKSGDFVNVERALLPETRLGGHYVTGHIDGAGQIRQIETHPDWRKIFVTVPEPLARQMASKGSVAIDGVSLTLVDVGTDYFSVVLIPHTLSVTTIGNREVADRVNIETDLLAKYVERQLEFLSSTK